MHIVRKTNLALLRDIFDVLLSAFSFLLMFPGSVNTVNQTLHVTGIFTYIGVVDFRGEYTC